MKSFLKQFSADTFKVIEKWFSIGIRNWAHTDVTCGELIYPMLQIGIIDISYLESWRSAENKFQRRAVPVAIIKILKTNPDFKPFFTLIEPLMMDPEREVHQGLGWFLREAWKINRDETEKFLLKWKDKSPRLIFQHACEKMTKEGKLRFKKEK